MELLETSSLGELPLYSLQVYVYLNVTALTD
jgi:hypothetical protein